MKISERELCRLCHVYNHLINDYISYLNSENLEDKINGYLKDYEKFKKSPIGLAHDSISEFMKKDSERSALGINIAKQHLLESYNTFKKYFSKSAFKHLSWINNIEKILKEN